MSLRNLAGALVLGLSLAACSAAVSTDATSESVGFDASAKSCCASEKAAVKAAECSPEKMAACAEKKAACTDAAKAECSEKKAACDSAKPVTGS